MSRCRVFKPTKSCLNYRRCSKAVYTEYRPTYADLQQLNKYNFLASFVFHVIPLDIFSLFKVLHVKGAIIMT